MNKDDVLANAFAMPLINPAYPKGPYRFINREYFIVTYKTDIKVLRQMVPEPLEVCEPLVKFEFIRMPDSTGFGNYTESGQVIPVSFNGKKGGYVLSMYLDDEAPIAGGREIWGFPKKLGNPSVEVFKDCLVGNLIYENFEVAHATMGYKYQSLDHDSILQSLLVPNYLLKIIPDVDGSLRICELVEYYLQDITLKGAWTGPATIALTAHALAPVSELPVFEIVSGVHILTDLTLPYGKVVFDYLK